MRNPWGRGEWTGEWSDGSPLWTEELRKKHNVVAEDDGTFCIPFDKYLTQFERTSICSECCIHKYQHSNIICNFNL